MPPLAPADVVDAGEALVLTLRVSGDVAAFGRVAADGAIDPAAEGVTSTADERGAWYAKERAVAVTIDSAAPWTGACSASENLGSAATVQVAAGRLEWRLSGSAQWRPLALGVGAACFPDPAVGTATYVYDLRLRVERTDAPGTFRSVITFTVSA